VRAIMCVGGTMLSAVNLLPMPWPLRLVWLRFVYFLTVKGTLLFPSILGFVEGQNVAYRMGKQEGERYESMVQLEKVLESAESSHVSIDRISESLAQAEPLIFYRSQPLCKGGGEIHNIYFRCYFLPLYGRQARIQQELEWLEDKLDLCRQYIAQYAAGLPGLPAKPELGYC